MHPHHGALHRGAYVTCGQVGFVVVFVFLCRAIWWGAVRKVSLTAVSAIVTLKLDLCWRLRDDAIRLVAERCPNLRDLSLQRLLHMTSASLELLALQLRGLRSLDLTDCVSLRDWPKTEWPSLEALVLCGCIRLNFVPERAKLPALRTLDVFHLAHMSNDFLKRLFVSLPTLRTLLVSGNKLSLAAGVQGGERLEALTMTYCPIPPARLVQMYPDLTALDLKHCGVISMEGIGVLMRSLSRLQSIDISHCLGLQDPGLLLAVQQLQTKSLRRFCALGAIEDVFCALTQQAAFELSVFRGLVQNAPAKGAVLEHIEELELQPSALGDDGATAIFNRLETVTELRIVGCRGVTMKSLELLSHCCPLLRRLDLEDVGASTADIFPVLNRLSALREVRFGGFTFNAPKLEEVAFLRRLTSLEFFCSNFGRSFWLLIAFCARQLRRLRLLRCIPQVTIELDLSAHPMLDHCSLRRVGVQPLNVAKARHLLLYEAYMVENIAGYTFFERNSGKGNGTESLSITLLSLDDIAGLGREELQAFSQSPVAAGLLTLHNLNVVEFYLVCPNLFRVKRSCCSCSFCSVNQSINQSIYQSSERG